VGRHKTGPHRTQAGISKMVSCRPYLSDQRPNGSIQIFTWAEDRCVYRSYLDGCRPDGSMQKIFGGSDFRSVSMKLEIY
jgi:hypothetical protein